MVFRRQLVCGCVVSLGYFEEDVWAIIWIDTYLLFSAYLVGAISSLISIYSPFSVNNSKRDFKLCNKITPQIFLMENHIYFKQRVKWNKIIQVNSWAIMTVHIFDEFYLNTLLCGIYVFDNNLEVINHRFATQ